METTLLDVRIAYASAADKLAAIQVKMSVNLGLYALVHSATIRRNNSSAN